MTARSPLAHQGSTARYFTKRGHGSASNGPTAVFDGCGQPRILMICDQSRPRGAKMLGKVVRLRQAKSIIMRPVDQTDAGETTPTSGTSADTGLRTVDTIRERYGTARSSTRCATPSYRYSPIVRMTLLSGRVLFDDSLSSCASISSYFGTVVTSPFGTMCTTL
jgi:hypothetical protein